METKTKVETHAGSYEVNPPYDPAADTKTQVAEVLAREAANSYIGVTGDLYTLATLPPLSRDYDATIAIATQRTRQTYARATPENAKSRLELLKQMLIPDMDDPNRSDRKHRSNLSKKTKWTGDKTILEVLEASFGKTLVIAGGAVSAAVWNPRYKDGDDGQWRYSTHIEDIDIFIVGLTETEARAHINVLAEALTINYGEITQLRSERCITFRITGGGDYTRDTFEGRYSPLTHTIQVILRLYNTVSEVLHGFDLGSSAIAYYKGDIVMSAKGYYAYARGLNILDLSRRRASYEIRIAKYANRGFAIALPEFDIAKLATFKQTLKMRNESKGKNKLVEISVQLPQLTLEISKIEGATIIAAIGPKTQTEWAPKYVQANTFIRGNYTAYTETKVPIDIMKAIPEEEMKATAEMDALIAGLGHNRNIIGLIYTYLENTDIHIDENAISDYASDGAVQYAPSRIVWNNIMALNNPTPKTASLCLITHYDKKTPVEDACVAGYLFPSIDKFIRQWCDPLNLNPTTLAKLFGRTQATALITEMMNGKIPDSKDLAYSLISQHTPRGALPFRFMRVEESTCLAGGGVLRMAIMTPREWYGEYWRSHELTEK